MWIWFLFVLWVCGFGCIPHLLLLNKRPTATLAWLWAILLFPGVGLGFYLAVGTERVKRLRGRRRHSFRRKEKLSSLRQETAQTTTKLFPTFSTHPIYHELIQTLSKITGLPTDTASRIQILRNADVFYASLRQSLRTAQKSIHIESFIWRDDEVGAEFLELLVAAAKRGVKVRLLLDELGCLGLTARYFRPLIAARGEFSWCHTLYPRHNRYFFNLRNHRKLQIIDSQVAYIGGMNFGREYLGLNPALGSWSDLQMELEGSVVAMLQQVFVEDWFFATESDAAIDHLTEGGEEDKPRCVAQVLRGGPDENDQPMLRMNLAMISTVQKRLWISTGYFVPGETMQAALQVAIARGVDVRLLISEKSEHPLLVKAGRSYYNALLRQGVRIFEYRRGIEHSKYTILDDEAAVVGSSNFDDRSMRLNFELSVLVYDRETNRSLVRLFNEMTAECREIKRPSFSRRPISDQLIESALRLCSPLL